MARTDRLGTTIGIDIGTTSVKAVAVDRDGRVLARERLPHRLLTPGPGRLEHDPAQAWARGPLQALSRVLATTPAAVAVTAMAPSLAAVDATGMPHGPGLLYGDERGHVEHASSALGISSQEAAQFLRHLSAQHPEASGYWPAAAIANHALGGVNTLDYSSAITSGDLFKDGGWNAEILAEAGVDAGALPGLAVMGAEIGRTHLGEAVLAAGSVDVFGEQLVSGADEVGDVLVMCGTTLIVWTVVAAMKEVPGLWAVPQLSGNWMSGGASNAGGLFLGWAASLLPASEPARDPGNVPIWIPYVRGERTPFHDSSLRASLHGMALTHGPAELQRAAWEAAGFVVRHHIELTGEPTKRVVAVGGGTRVEGWIQAMADATNLPVHVSAVPEGAALGAAYLAGMALGHDDGASFAGASAWARTGHIVEPDARWAGPTAERYATWRALGPRL